MLLLIPHAVDPLISVSSMPFLSHAQSEMGFPFAVDASAKEGDRVCLLAKTMFVGDSEKAKVYPLQVCGRLFIQSLFGYANLYRPRRHNAAKHGCMDSTALTFCLTTYSIWTRTAQVVFRRHGVSSRLLTSPVRIVSKPSQKKSARVTAATDESMRRWCC